MGGEVARLVDQLRTVPGVADAEISTSDGGPGTLRLALDPGADEVAVATAVNRLLRDGFGLAVDADRVQVLEETDPGDNGLRSPSLPSWMSDSPALSPPAERLGGHAAPMPPRAPDPVAPAPDPEPTIETAAPVQDLEVDLRPPRLAIERLQMVSAGLGVTTEVTLSWSGIEHSGAAEAAATPTGVQRAVAEATLRAVESVLDRSARFVVEHVESTQLGPDKAVVVEVAMVTGRGSERLIGVSTVREDTRQAVVRATLAGLNRRLESLLALR